MPSKFFGQRQARYFAAAGYDAAGWSFRDTGVINSDKAGTVMANFIDTVRTLNPSAEPWVVTNLNTTVDTAAGAPVSDSADVGVWVGRVASRHVASQYT